MKIQKQSHSTLRAERATFTLQQSNSVTRQVNCERIKIIEKCDILSHFQTMCMIIKQASKAVLETKNSVGPKVVIATIMQSFRACIQVRFKTAMFDVLYFFSRTIKRVNIDQHVFRAQEVSTEPPGPLQYRVNGENLKKVEVVA